MVIQYVFLHEFGCSLSLPSMVLTIDNFIVSQVQVRCMEGAWFRARARAGAPAASLPAGRPERLSAATWRKNIEGSMCLHVFAR